MHNEINNYYRQVNAPCIGCASIIPFYAVIVETVEQY